MSSAERPPKKPSKMPSKKQLTAPATPPVYEQIRALITTARQTVARGVDLLQVRTNFEIGRHIVATEQQGQARAGYGHTLLTELAERLSGEFGKGFARSNLAYMRAFYLAYAERAAIVQTLSGQLVADPAAIGSAAALEIVQTASGQSELPFKLSWSHYVFLLGVKNLDERRFYEIEAAAMNWTVRELKRQFDTSLYERLALSRDKAGIARLAQSGQLIAKPADLLKDPLVLEFLGLAEQQRFSETDLESAIIGKIEQFLLELGKGFLFEARQKRFSLGGEHFFVDLVFYNRLLRCYVLIDLKLGRLTHQDLGQMQMYVNYFDRHLRCEGENASIGIVLCKEKNEALVEITLPADANIHAQAYQLYLPSKDELQMKLREWGDE